MAALTITQNPTSSSSLYSTFRTSPLTISSKITPDCSCLFNVRSGQASRQRLASQNRRCLVIRNAAIKTAKSPAEEEWKVKRELLLQKRVRSTDAKEAFRLQKENNFVILDVRPEAEYKQGHPVGAVNVQIYRLIKEWTAWDIARRAAFAFFGIFSGTEENPEFMQIVESKFDKEAKIIVACSAGGTMKPTQNLPEGQQSRKVFEVSSIGSRCTHQHISDSLRSGFCFLTLLRVL